MENLRGILLVIVAMAAFTVEDMFIKTLSSAIPVGQILMMLGIGSATIFALLSRRGGQRLFAPAAWRPVFFLRALCVDVAVSSTVVSFQGFAVLVPAGALLLVFTPGTVQPLDTAQAAMIAGGMVFGAIGYYGIVSAMRLGDASAITPFRYTRLLFSLIVGVVVFRETPDGLTLLGAGLIMATGLYTFLRERRLARRS